MSKFGRKDKQRFFARAGTSRSRWVSRMRSTSKKFDRNMKTSRIPGKPATVIKTGVVAPDPHGSAPFWEPGSGSALNKNPDPH
jgi:hypothetical protein